MSSIDLCLASKCIKQVYTYLSCVEMTAFSQTRHAPWVWWEACTSNLITRGGLWSPSVCTFIQCPPSSWSSDRTLDDNTKLWCRAPTVSTFDCLKLSSKILNIFEQPRDVDELFQSDQEKAMFWSIWDSLEYSLLMYCQSFNLDLGGTQARFGPGLYERNCGHLSAPTCCMLDMYVENICEAVSELVMTKLRCWMLMCRFSSPAMCLS